MHIKVHEIPIKSAAIRKLVLQPACLKGFTFYKFKGKEKERKQIKNIHFVLSSLFKNLCYYKPTL